MQSVATQPICIYRAHWDRVEKAAGVEPIHAAADMKAKPITKKDTKPGGKALQRQARVPAFPRTMGVTSFSTNSEEYTCVSGP